MFCISRTAEAEKTRTSRFRLSALMLIGAAVLFNVPVGKAQAQGAAPLIERYVKNRVIVQPRAGLSTERFDQILKAHGGRRAQVIRQLNVHIIELPAHAKRS